MGQGACGGYLRRDASLIKPSYATDDNKNIMAELRKIAELEIKKKKKVDQMFAEQKKKSEKMMLKLKKMETDETMMQSASDI